MVWIVNTRKPRLIITSPAATPAVKQVFRRNRQIHLQPQTGENAHTLPVINKHVGLISPVLFTNNAQEVGTSADQPEWGCEKFNLQVWHVLFRKAILGDDLPKQVEVLPHAALLSTHTSSGSAIKICLPRLPASCLPACALLVKHASRRSRPAVDCAFCDITYMQQMQTGEMTLTTSRRYRGLQHSCACSPSWNMVSNRMATAETR